MQQAAMVPNKMLMEPLSSVYYNGEHGESIATNPSTIQIMEILPRNRCEPSRHVVSIVPALPILTPVRGKFPAFQIKRYVKINSYKQLQNTGTRRFMEVVKPR